MYGAEHTGAYIIPIKGAELDLQWLAPSSLKCLITWLGTCRECSTAFYLTPYRGKYTPPPTTPDTLRSQMVLAGMADRGATACVYESNLSSLQSGW